MLLITLRDPLHDQSVRRNWLLSACEPVYKTEAFAFVASSLHRHPEYTPNPSKGIMAPLTHPLTNTSSPMPPYSMTPATPFQAGNQTQWGPDSIGTIFFGILMFFMASVALWQGRQRAKQRDHGTYYSMRLLRDG